MLVFEVCVKAVTCLCLVTRLNHDELMAQVGMMVLLSMSAWCVLI